DGGRAVPLPSRPVRPDRLAPLQQARPRSVDRRRRLRLARGSPRPARGGARLRVRRSPGAPAGAAGGPARLVWRANPAPGSPPPAPRRTAVVGTQPVGAGKSRAWLLHLRPPPRALPRGGGAFRDPHHRDPRPMERPEGPDRGGRDGGEAA